MPIILLPQAVCIPGAAGPTAKLDAAVVKKPLRFKPFMAILPTRSHSLGAPDALDTSPFQEAAP
jgi:hypothetical protein